MENVTFPLEPGMRGSGVRNLQEGLQVLLERVAILPGNPDLRAQLSDALKPEQGEAIFGETTKRLVHTFQEERQLKAVGLVNETTALTLNTVLRALGAIPAE